MSGPLGSSQWMYATGADFFSYQLNQSLRFDGSSSYLNFTPSSSTAGTFTVSFWVKKTKTGVTQYVYYSGAVNQRGGFGFNTSDQFFVSPFNSSGANANLFSDMLFRDVGAWYHIVIEANAITYSNLSTAMNIYVNGQEITHTKTQLSTPTGGDRLNDTQAKNIGTLTPSPSSYFPGYLAEWHWVDGTALDADNFGETNNGIWVPKEYTGSHGSAGYYLPFDDSSAIGDDESGNTNDWTANNLAASDVVPDSPTNNFATISPMANTSLSEGNLKLTTSRTGYWDGTIGSFGVSSGKWYHEVRFSLTETTFRCVAGWIGNQASQTVTLHGKGGTGSPFGTLFDNYAVTSWLTSFYKDGGNDGTMTAPASGDVMNIAADFDNGKIWFGVNGTYYANDGGTDGDPAAGTNESLSGIDLTASEYVPFFAIRSDNTAGGNVMIANFGQEGTFAGTETDGGYSDGNGQGSFFNTVPSGFLALCTSNLPEPAIGPNSAEQADDYFNTLLYTGDGTTSRSITGVGFAPDFIWGKCRSNAEDHILSDTVRGANKKLESNNTGAEDTSTAATLSGFESDGFTGPSSTPGNINVSGRTYVAWNWKAGGTAVSNTDGSITSSVSANQDAGFSVVTYTGAGTGTVGHGLGITPSMYIVKCRSNGATNWRVYHKGIASDAETDYLTLDSTAAAADLNFWNDTAPTSSVFSVFNYDDTGTSSRTYVAYVFADVEGFSKAGAYTGNGNANGTFVYTGFRPAWVMIKNATTAGTNWIMFDNKRSTFNVTNDALLASASNTEYVNNSSFAIDMLSNGFKARSNYGDINQSGNTITYLAFAEAPFKYANAR